ncbi:MULTISPECIES: NACHT domain-containing protein [Cyanophyceae]|uniref:NACHT domain-containing protein n=1 Tax=Cyanophyceae TaxID=3028117 RepID=UPI0016859D48|nr:MULTISPECIES: NACHT domain-containing protein [Cyanophyceae]MBD1916108.1 NACHT domain-containing protein [Phormidium sp. FACHB-77]MBD2031623.1 NACHT domain-containing protein [Phormidium sp. FACHB-322]MBD2052750.1 NACHT domain-containing protein [Leptolyngbya sp. FACHB-60]
MTSQEQRVDGSQIEDSQVQLTQAERDAVSFQNSHDNQVTINNTIVRLSGQTISSTADWDWATRLLEQKQLPEIRKRLIDTLGRERQLMAVGLQEQLGWVGRSPLETERTLQVQGKDQGSLDPCQLLIETFGRDDIAGKLLILGTPGAGKTTALLSLAEQLVLGALAKPKTVIPVLFELSTWRKDNQSIRDWLIEQLYEQHGGNRKAKLYEQWLDQQVLLPLLDGLDELGFDRQQKCTQKLNEFARQYPKLVVCCRVKEFAQANIKLNTMNGAICLEPLSNEQIQTYLEMQQSPLWSVIEASPTLQTLLEPTTEGEPGLLRIPLFVTLAANVYDSQRSFRTKAELLNQYIDRQLLPEVRESDRRNAVEKRSWAYKTPELEPDWRQTERTLAWLARQLQQTNTVEILIEQIQPRWLETKQSRRRYQLIGGLIGGLIVGLTVGPTFGLIGGLAVGPTFGLISGLIVGLISGPIIGLIVGLDDIKPVEAFRIAMSHDVRREILNTVRGWVISGLIIGLTFGLIGGLVNGLISGLISSLISGLIGGLISGLIVGLISGLIVGLIVGLKQDLQLRSRPNQGIWNSLQSFGWTTLLSYPLGVILVFGITELPNIVVQGIGKGESMGVIVNSLREVFPQALVLGIFGAMFFGLGAGGGIACVDHVCLRFVLWQSSVAPRNLARFLNYCVERRLLQRVGGRYRFLHRELLDHFAQLPAPGRSGATESKPTSL